MMTAADEGWWHRGNCATMPGFLSKGPRTQRQTCADCPVRMECLTEAIATEADDPALPGKGWPVRGGLLGEERRALIMKQAGRRPVAERRTVRRSDLVPS